MEEVQCDYANNFGITVFIGGCGEDGKWFRRKAHAHNHKDNEYFGSICFLSAKRLYNADGSPSNTLKHEVAHILAGGGHTEKWAAVFRSLGGKVPTSYYKHLK